MVNSSNFSIESAVDKATKKVCFIEDSMDGDEHKDSSTPKDDDDFELLDGVIITGEEDGYMYKKKLVKAIGDRIGLVVRLDDNTDNSFQGQFAKMAVFLDLNKLFISKIKIEDKVQRIEYKSLPNVSFSFVFYRHSKKSCHVMKFAIDRQENFENVFVPTPFCPN
ncbi:hypothetical protein Goari_004256 [Gossypium aridum]|uniref:DUF4283 domain-containing protein n=1 Tax=Gossypium aridum TaxID=34290 RepID=A0A7J8Y2X8_GOSAI|nr:hypothetical protein [Gossypium aridum]